MAMHQWLRRLTCKRCGVPSHHIEDGMCPSCARQERVYAFSRQKLPKPGVMSDEEAAQALDDAANGMLPGTVVLIETVEGAHLLLVGECAQCGRITLVNERGKCFRHGGTYQK